MTVKELRYLVDNLDEYIHVPGGIERLKKTVLHLAVSGQLVPQDPSEGTGEELFQQIQAEKAKLIAAGKLKKQKPLPAITEAEIPFAIPKTWKWVRLGELTPHYQNGISSRGDKSGKEVIVLRLADIKNKKISLANTRTLTIKDTDVDRYDVRPGDILVTRVNGSAEIVGQFNLANKSVDAIYCDHFIRMRISHDWLIPRFIELLGASSLVRQRINDMFITTAGQKTINQNHLNRLLIPIVCVTEQRRILEKVDAIFELIDELAEKYRAEQAEREKLVASSLAQLARGNGYLALTHLSEIIRTKADAAQLRKTILHLAVSGQLVPQDPSEGTGEELYQQIQSEKAKLIAAGKLKKHKHLPEVAEAEIPFAIPKTWKWARLGDAIDDISGGGTPSKSNADFWGGDIPWASIKDLNVDLYIDDTQDHITLAGSLSKTNIIKPAGSILIGTRMGLGKVAISTRDMAINQDLKAITVGQSIDKEYFINYLKTLTLKGTGTTVDGITQDKLLAVLVPLPPLAEQSRIVQKTTQLLDLVTQLESNLEAKQ